MSHPDKIRYRTGSVPRALGAFVLGTVAAKLLWGWMVARVARPAVDQGLLSSSLPWTAALVLGLVLGVLVFLVVHGRVHGARHTTLLGSPADG